MDFSGNRWVALAVALILATHAAGAQAGTIRHDQQDSFYRDLAATAPYASVGMVTQAGGIGSGVLVSKDWLLKADSRDGAQGGYYDNAAKGLCAAGRSLP